MKPHIGIYTCVISRNYDCLPFSRCLQYLVWTHIYELYFDFAGLLALQTGCSGLTRGGGGGVTYSNVTIGRKWLHHACSIYGSTVFMSILSLYNLYHKFIMYTRPSGTQRYGYHNNLNSP